MSEGSVSWSGYQTWYACYGESTPARFLCSSDAKILGIVWIILGCGIASVLNWKGRSLDTSDV